MGLFALLIENMQMEINHKAQPAIKVAAAMKMVFFFM